MILCWPMIFDILILVTGRCGLLCLLAPTITGSARFALKGSFSQGRTDVISMVNILHEKCGLVERGRREIPFIGEVRGQLASRLAVIPWAIAPPVGVTHFRNLAANKYARWMVIHRA